MVTVKARSVTISAKFFGPAIVIANDFIDYWRWLVLPSQRAHLFQNNIYR